MKYLLSFALSLSLASAGPVIRKRQTPNGGGAYNPKDDTLEMNLSQYCSQEQRNSLVDSIAESGYLAYALDQWGSNPLYEQDMEKFMGKDIAGTVKSRLQDNIRRGLEVRQGKIDTSVYIHCGDDNGSLRFKDCTAGVDAYTWDEGDAHHVVLCENFWNYPTLAERLEDVFANPDTAHDISSLYNNKASVWFHETTHWGGTVSQPRVLDYDPKLGKESVYGPQSVEDNALQNGADSNSMVADAYSVVSMAALLTQIFEIEEALETGNATSSGMDTAEPAMMADGYKHLATRQYSTDVSGENWSVISGSLSQIDPSKYTAESGNNGVDDNNQSPTPESTQKAPEPEPEPTQQAPKPEPTQQTPEPETTQQATSPTPEAPPPPPSPSPPTNGNDNANDNNQCEPDDPWLAVDDGTSNNQKITGFRTAVQNFCSAANGITLAANGRYYLSMVLNSGITWGGKPSESLEPGFVYLEIHNQQSQQDHTVQTDACVEEFTSADFLDDPEAGCDAGAQGILRGGLKRVQSGATYGAMGVGVQPGEEVGQRVMSTEDVMSAITEKLGLESAGEVKAGEGGTVGGDGQQGGRNGQQGGGNNQQGGARNGANGRGGYRQGRYGNASASRQKGGIQRRGGERLKL